MERFSVVNSQPWMANELEAIQRASFPTLAPNELMGAQHFLAHQQVFPQGQHAVIERSSQKVVASSTDFRTKVDFYHLGHRFIEVAGGGWLSGHDPHGDWLYGADIGVLPQYRGQGLSTLLYQARQDLVQRLGLKGHVAGAMPKGYGAVQEQMPIEAYVAEVVCGHRTDPVLSVQLKRGYRVWGIIPDHLDDPSCGNYGVFIVWRNPQVRSW